MTEFLTTFKEATFMVAMVITVDVLFPLMAGKSHIPEGMDETQEVKGELCPVIVGR